MFDRLIESRRARRRPVAQSLASVVLHAALGAAAIHATRSAAEPMIPSEREQPIFLPSTRRSAPVLPPQSNGGPRPITMAPVDLPALPPPIDLPADPGPVAPSSPIDRLDFARASWPTGSGPGAPTVDASAMFRPEEVDEPVSVLEQPRPAYPPAFQMAGIAGQVDVRFVVDSAGRAEPSSWQVIASSNPAFEAPARESILRARYRAARIDGRPVRQLVAQRISFAIDR